MKKIFKRLNRGLLLGGIILFVLIIYIVTDYAGFSSEKPVIKEQVENYMNSFLDYLADGDYERISQLIDDCWINKTILKSSDYALLNKAYMDSSINDIISLTSDTGNSFSDIVCNIKSCTVKKSGPNMAAVDIEYTISLTYALSGNTVADSADLILPFDTYGYLYYDELSSDTIYDCVIQGVYTLYMCKDDGTWKIAQDTGYDWIASVTMTDAKEAE